MLSGIKEVFEPLMHHDWTMKEVLFYGLAVMVFGISIFFGVVAAMAGKPIETGLFLVIMAFSIFSLQLDIN